MLELSGPTPPSSRPPVRPIRARAFLAILALSVDGFLSLVMIIGYSIRIVLLHRVQAHVRVLRADLVASDAFIRGGSRVQLAVLVLSAIVFLFWLYRANQNLSAFRLEPLQYSPALAVGSFFIPILNLALPFFVMREIWQASDPALPPFGPGLYTSAPVSPWVPAWWGMFLARGVIAWLAILPGLGAKHTVATILKASQVLRVDLAVSCIAAGLACALIFLIKRRQEELAEKLALFKQADVF